MSEQRPDGSAARCVDCGSEAVATREDAWTERVYRCAKDALLTYRRRRASAGLHVQMYRVDESSVFLLSDTDLLPACPESSVARCP